MRGEGLGEGHAGGVLGVEEQVGRRSGDPAEPWGGSRQAVWTHPPQVLPTQTPRALAVDLPGGPLAAVAWAAQPSWYRIRTGRGEGLRATGQKLNAWKPLVLAAR